MTWRFGILKKLYKWGLRGNMPQFIESFLSDRFFRVSIGNEVSENRSLENGVPQGSTLSIMLFDIAVNSIVECIEPAVQKCMYVDDLAIFYSADIIEEIEENNEYNINKVLRKAEKSGFKFSSTKTKAIHFCRL